MFIVALILLIKANAIATLIIAPRSNSPNERIEISSLTAQAIAFSVVGVLIVAQALPKLLQIVMNVQRFKMKGLSGQAQEMLSNSWPSIIVFGTELILGIALFVGGKGIATLWHELQRRQPFKNEES